MSITYSKFFAPQQLGIALTTLFTVPAGGNTFLRGGRVRLVNTTNAAVTVQLNAVPNGGSASAANQLTSTNFSVPANLYVDIDLPVMVNGDFLQALAGAATSITIHSINGGYFS